MTFLKRTRVTLEELNNAWRDGDVDKTKLIAHKLKSAIDLARINDLKEEIRFVEKYAKDVNKVSEVNQKIQAVDNILRQVFKEMEEEM